MHLVIRTASGMTYTSDRTSKEEILEAVNGDEAKYDSMMEEVYGMAAHIKDLDSFSIIAGGQKIYFNPDNIETIQVFE